MLDVFTKKKSEEVTSEPKEDNTITRELKVGMWFRIDRGEIEKNKEYVRCKCNEAGDEGKELWKRFEESNKIADENPDKYPCLIETYIFEPDPEGRTEQQMICLCKQKGDGMCDTIICNLELQMRICNGESVDKLVKKQDTLPEPRIVKSRNGVIYCFGGGKGPKYTNCASPADLRNPYFYFGESYSRKIYDYAPYAFRKVLSS